MDGMSNREGCQDSLALYFPLLLLGIIPEAQVT